MFEIRITGTNNIQQYEELVKVFLQPSEYRMAGPEPRVPAGPGASAEPADADTPADPRDAEVPEAIRLEYHYEGDRDALARSLYEDLAGYTGKRPKWGVLTGIRPVKLAGEMQRAGKDPSQELARERLVHPDKVNLVTEILDYQQQTAGEPEERSLSVYLGIPFCPTRCLYCSFTSNQVGEEEIARYLEALDREIDYAGAAAAEDGFRIESFYIGGGTPTTLDPGQLDHLLDRIRSRFDLKALREFTVEAGRPDTITREKLEVLKMHGIDRISINPQSMHQKTLDTIGRRHTVRETEEAFALAREAGDFCINTDLIAGLPGEDLPDFASSLEQILALGADNITLHTLAVKRASRLKEMDENFNYREEQLREEMLSSASDTLRGRGYRPYYLYRQKHTSGNTENIGYCREDRISIYNIRIMEERQSILALGAGGISKIWFPRENRLERIPNVSNYEIYIDRIDEMIQRKRKGFFGKQEVTHVNKRT